MNNGANLLTGHQAQESLPGSEARCDRFANDFGPPLCATPAEPFYKLNRLAVYHNSGRGSGGELSKRHQKLKGTYNNLLWRTSAVGIPISAHWIAFRECPVILYQK